MYSMLYFFEQSILDTMQGLCTKYNYVKWFGQDIYAYNSNIIFGDCATIELMQ